MTDASQVNHLISEVKRLNRREFGFFLKEINGWTSPQEAKTDNLSAPLDTVFGLWKNRDMSIAALRVKAWKRV